jgi:hypothetical protein
MSLYGYVKKNKPALWTKTYPQQHSALRPPCSPKKKSKLSSKKSIQRSNSIQSRKPLKRVSTKRSSENRTYAKLRIPFLREHPICQRQGCGAKSVCVHHWAGRRSNFLKIETWRASCIPCNDFAKNNPKEAREENWIATNGVYLT